MSFADSFWTADHSSGLKVVFDKLKQGCAENNELLDMVTDRIKLENAYGGGLQSFPARHELRSEGFDRDEGASLKQAFTGYLSEIANEGLVHTRIANDLEKNVRLPFHKWSQSHKRRILDCETLIVNRVTNHHKNQQKVGKLQQSYFAKCRQLEELDPSVGTAGISRGFSLSAYLDRSTSASTSASANGTNGGTGAATTRPTEEQTNEDSNHTITLGSSEYTDDTVGVLLHAMLQEIPRQTYRVPIIGAYENVSTSADISLWIRKRLKYANLSKAEKFGQDLLDYGYLKPLGLANRGRFQCSETSRYQWSTKALVYELTDRPTRGSSTSTQVDTMKRDVQGEKRLPNPPTSPDGSVASSRESIRTLVDETQPIPQPNPELKKHENSAYLRERARLQAEIEDADSRYREAVMILDDDRWDLEEEIRRVLQYLENCEKERLRVVKKVFLNFANDISRNQQLVPAISQQMLLFHESVQPSKDIGYLVERYQTGYFIPRPVTYENFDSALKIQTFGVSVMYSSFAVPLFLEYINSKLRENESERMEEIESEIVEKTEEDDKKEHKEEMSEEKSEGKTTEESSPPAVPEKPKKVRFSADTAGIDDAYDSQKDPTPLEMWAQNVHQLVSVHQLRKQINTGEPFDPEVLSFFPLTTVIATFCQYLLELPDSLVSFAIYDVIKNIYNTNYAETSDRLNAIASALVQTEEMSVKLLKQVIEHFLQNIKVYLGDTGNGTDAQKWTPVAAILAPYLVRPRVTNSMTMTDKHPKLVIRDLVCNHEQIFSLVAQKRAKQETRRRERSVSTSGANRKAAIEERNKAFVPVRANDSPTPSVVSSSGLIPLTLSPTSETLSVSPLRKSINGDSTPTKRSSITPVVKVDPPSPEQPKS